MGAHVLFGHGGQQLFALRGINPIKNRAKPQVDWRCCSAGGPKAIKFAASATPILGNNLVQFWLHFPPLQDPAFLA